MQLERNAVTNYQYHKRETTEMIYVPESLEGEILKENVCKALPPTGISVAPEQLHSCHHLKKGSRVILKFESQNVLFNRKILKDKSSSCMKL